MTTDSLPLDCSASELSIEQFTPAYAQAVGELISTIQREEFEIPITLAQQPDLADIAGYYQKGVGNFWVATNNSHIVGTISLLDIGDGQVALRKMFVHPDYRGATFGTAHKLLSTAFQWCCERGVKEIYLGTTAQFLAAHRFYRKNGFVEVAKASLPATFPVMSVDTMFFRSTVVPLV